MSFAEFTLEAVEQTFSIIIQETAIFEEWAAIEIPSWLPDMLARGTRLALISEKARSEFIVVPILLAARELSDNRFAIFSGQRFDVEPESGLIGECDFILAIGPAVPPLHAPVMMMVEAKKNDVEVGLGQCIAQMVAARKFNEATGRTHAPIFGCVTTGETWQFLRLVGPTVQLHHERIYLSQLGNILAALHAIYQIAINAEAQHRMSA